MRKFKLDLDNLRVDSFDTTPTREAVERGTVKAQYDTCCDTCCDCTCMATCDTCYTNCGTCYTNCGTCPQDWSCGGTCDSCDSCYDSCGGSCYDTCGRDCPTIPV